MFDFNKISPCVEPNEGAAKDPYFKAIEATLDKARDVLLSKKREYATVDHFHNFRVAATLEGKSMKEALAGMLAKHTVSVYDMCNSGAEFTPEQWDEKIIDHINYLLILRAMVALEGPNA